MDDKMIKENFKLRGRIRATLRDAKTGRITYQTEWNHNVITTVGLTATMRRWANVASVANEGMVTYGAVGNGSVTPVAGDTTMENEVARNTIATGTVSGTTATIEAFFAEAVANDTITQFALFGEDASASADSGTMFNHASFASSFVKTSSETLSVEVQITAS
jgi:hypothetical protein